MTSDSFQLTRTAAQNYEGRKVPAIFRPLAEATVDAVTLNKHDTVLDGAGGTGIVLKACGRGSFPVTTGSNA